jgi:plastocyanin
MHGSTMRKVIGGVVGIGAIALGAGYAFGASETITSSPSCCTYTKSTFTIDAGQVANFDNGTAGTPHTVTAPTNGPDKNALFDSGTTPGGGQSPVDGTQYLAAGTYHFICEIHGPSMSADLVVTGNGTPVARPEVAVKVLSRKLDGVVSSGKLKVKLSAATASDGVSLTARKGAKKLGSKRNIDLSAGASRTVKLPLTAAGKNALEDLSSAKVKVTGSVPFGAQDTAKRRLH